MSSTDKIILLKSSDGESFEVERAVALQFRTIYQMIEEMEVHAEGIPLPNVTSGILSKVIEYCKMHVVDTDHDGGVAAATGDRGAASDDGGAAVTGSDGGAAATDRGAASSDGGAAAAADGGAVAATDGGVAGDNLQEAEFVKVDRATLFDLVLISVRVFGIHLKILSNVTGKILSKVIECCQKPGVDTDCDSSTADTNSDSTIANTDSDSSVSSVDLRAWDAEFVKVNQATLFDLILAANYLNIQGLLDLTCQAVADMIKGKTPERIEKRFTIRNDYTSEEEEEIRREKQWEFE